VAAGGVMKVVVGCPVLYRQWIMNDWFDHVERAFEKVDVEPVYAFVGDQILDPTFEIIDRRAKQVVVDVEPVTRPDDHREWNQGRYRTMVDLRNRLLRLVRAATPQVFLSLDSDILLHPDAVALLLEDLEGGLYDAVGSRCFMTQTGRSCPSWARLGPHGQLHRYDAAGFFPVQVIMAIKAMTRPAYLVDYELHAQGEDIGWSLAAGRAGVRLGWDGRVASKHVMAPELLHLRDPRCGF
jgi:hypothetical protein